jgi:mannose-1-phosphate guanylyltransferase
MLQERSARAAERDWAIVLAAGDGTRLQSLTGGVPKQFCRLVGERSLLGMALDRARRICAPERTLVVVSPRHRAWWRRELACHPRENVLVQPENRGTAPGLLLPLLAALEREPGASVVLFPSDHFVRDESRIAIALRGALEDSAGGAVVLLGIEPGWAETGYGWVLPASPGPSAPVAAFVEKPSPELARACLERGGVWNSFLLAARGRDLLALFEHRTPLLVAAFRAALSAPGSRRSALAELYRGLVPLDFSRDVLQGSEPSLRVRVVPECGWTDLGTPERVALCLAQGMGADVRARARATPRGELSRVSGVQSSAPSAPARASYSGIAL